MKKGDLLLAQMLFRVYVKIGVKGKVDGSSRNRMEKEQKEEHRSFSKQ